MSRNKYPERTIQKILNVSTELFLEKGYEQTTIKDIIKESGFTRGAVYHHFISKEDIANVVVDKLCEQENPFLKVMDENDLTPLEKIKKAILLSVQNVDNCKLLSCLDWTKHPKLFSLYIDKSHETSFPIIKELLGNIDYNAKLKYDSSIPEFLFVIITLWLSPLIQMQSPVDYEERLKLSKCIFDSLGLPIFDDIIF